MLDRFCLHYLHIEKLNASFEDIEQDAIYDEIKEALKPLKKSMSNTQIIDELA